MNKVIIVISLFISIIVTNSIAISAEKETVKKDSQTQGKAETQAPLPEIDKKKEEELKAKAEAQQKAKETLNKQKWTINLTLSTGQKKKTKTDTLTFSDGKVSSEELSSEGYSTSNYTLTIQDGGTIVWETMQSNEKVGLAFWRGELRGKIMSGILSLHPHKGEAQDFYFISVTEEEKPKPEEKAPKKETKETITPQTKTNENPKK